jgi:hypothetical protein
MVYTYPNTYPNRQLEPYPNTHPDPHTYPGTPVYPYDHNPRILPHIPPINVVPLDLTKEIQLIMKKNEKRVKDEPKYERDVLKKVAMKMLIDSDFNLSPKGCIEKAKEFLLRADKQIEKELDELF